MADGDAVPEVPTRFLSHQDVLPLDLIRARHFTVAGCGAVGTIVARLLARLGAHRFHLVDGGEVEERHLNCQVFSQNQVGMNKAAALATQLQEVHPKVRCITTSHNLGPDDLVPGKQDFLILTTDDASLAGQVLEWLAAWDASDRPSLWVAALHGSRGGYCFHDLKQGIPEGLPQEMAHILEGASFADADSTEHGDDEPCRDRPITTAYATAAVLGQAIIARLNIRPVKHMVTFDLDAMVAGDPGDLVIGVAGERPPQ